ncbi:MAG: transposase [Candidatus Poribacteria bacterium]|nr:transposase [Candidatus Poribacteria bacterium]
MQQNPNKGHSQLRKGRISIPGAYYSITLAASNREQILTTPGAPTLIFQCFDWLESNERLEWLCIMIMPDHIHTVFQLQNKQTLPQLIQSFKRFTAKQINVKLARTGAVWQENYYDHGIRRDASLNAIIRYCYENPVRKGLVEQPRDYPYWRCKYEME